MTTANDLYLGVLLDMAIWTLIMVGLTGFVWVCWEAWVEYQRQHQIRREWQRMPQTTIKPNVRLHKVL